MSAIPRRVALFLGAHFFLLGSSLCAAVATAQNAALVSQMARNEAAARGENTHTATTQKKPRRVRVDTYGEKE